MTAKGRNKPQTECPEKIGAGILPDQGKQAQIEQKEASVQS